MKSTVDVLRDLFNMRPLDERKYLIVNCNQRFNEATQYAFNSLEEAVNCGAWLLSGSLYIVSYVPVHVTCEHETKGHLDFGYMPGSFKVEVSRHGDAV